MPSQITRPLWPLPFKRLGVQVGGLLRITEDYKNPTSMSLADL